MLYNSAPQQLNRKRTGRRFTREEEKDFLEFFSKLIGYHEKHGTYNVPVDYVVHEEGKEYNLGVWLQSQLMMLTELREYPFLENNFMYLVDSGQFSPLVQESSTINPAPRRKVARRSGEFKLDLALFDSPVDYLDEMNITTRVQEYHHSESIDEIMLLADSQEEQTSIRSDVLCSIRIDGTVSDSVSDGKYLAPTIDPIVIEKADNTSIIRSIELRDDIIRTSIVLDEDVTNSVLSLSPQDIVTDIENNIECILCKEDPIEEVYPIVNGTNNNILPAIETTTDSSLIYGDIIGFPYQYPDGRLALGIGLVCNKEVLKDEASNLFITFFSPADSEDPLISVYNLDVEETLVIKKDSVLLWNMTFKKGIAYTLRQQYFTMILLFFLCLRDSGWCFIIGFERKDHDFDGAIH